MSDRPFKVVGKVLEVGSAKEITDKFSKRELVIDIGVEREKPVKFDFGNKAMAKLDGAREGDNCEVSFYLNGFRGRKDPTQVYVGLNGIDYAVVVENQEQSDAPADDDDVPW